MRRNYITVLHIRKLSLVENKEALNLDFNPSIKWEFLLGDNKGYTLISLVEDCFSHQMIHDLTRYNNISDLFLPI